MSDYSVIVAGGGPAGATASILLAQHGHSVLLIDRDKHPRFHIGESMLPMSVPVFRRLGIDWKCGDFLPKNGAEFIDEASGGSIRFPLAGQHQPYQVERAKFDHMMLESAQAHGVEVHQQESVKDVEFRENTVAVLTNKAQYSARYLIDATGRSAMMGRQNRAIQRIDNLGRFSLYTHYREVNSPEADPIFDTGDVKIIVLDIGWFWVIPMTGRRLSVGLVVQKEAGVKERGANLFERYLAASPMLTSLLNGALQAFDIKAEADFSFSNTARHGIRYACCGDSAGFLDPVFSSGVFLAVKSAEMVADRLHEALIEGREGDEGIHAVDDEDYLVGFNSMRLFVERFYHAGLLHNLFFVAERNPEMKEDIQGLLSGDLWTDNNDFQKKLLRSRQAQKLNQ
jgi:flavin-dependent dehydrogenase